MQDDYYSGINPELAEASPVFAEIMGVSNELLSFGIDPSYALMAMAGVPVALRILRIVNEFTSAAAEDYRAKKAIENEQRRGEMRITVRKRAKEAGIGGISVSAAEEDKDIFDE